MDDKKVKKMKLKNGDYGIAEYKGFEVRVGDEEGSGATWTRSSNVTSIADFKGAEEAEAEAQKE